VQQAEALGFKALMVSAETSRRGLVPTGAARTIKTEPVYVAKCLEDSVKGQSSVEVFYLDCYCVMVTSLKKVRLELWAFIKVKVILEINCTSSNSDCDFLDTILGFTTALEPCCMRMPCVPSCHVRR
jgi:hypothetical protein